MDQARVALVLIEFITFLVAWTLNTLAAFGERSGVFTQSTEDVTLKYATAITPAGWSLFVWDFIYVWLFCMFVYLLVGLCRRTAYEWLYTSPAVLPYGFHVSLILNLSLNIAWLFLFDRELLIIAVVVSGLMALTSYSMLFFSCHGLNVYGAWLSKYHTVDLWLIRILLQNGVAVYATWTTVATLLNLTVVLDRHTEMAKCESAMLSLLLLLLMLLVWFLLENFYLDLDKHVRYTVAMYPVLIVVLAGCMSHPGSPVRHINIFTGIILSISCVMFVARITMVIWKHRNQPLYTADSLMTSPVERARRQMKLLL